MTQVSPDMVERAARAMLAAHDWTVGVPTADGEMPSGFDEMPEDWKKAYRAMATAALTAALGDKYVIVEKDISDARLNILLGRVESAAVTPMHTMFRDFYRLVIAGGKPAPTPEQQ